MSHCHLSYTQVLDVYDEATISGDQAEAVAAHAGIGQAQLVWLQAQLSVADVAGERVIILAHLSPRGALPNGSTVLDVIATYPGVVTAVISLDDGAGGHSVDARGVQ